MTRPVEPSAVLPASLAARPVDARRGLPIPSVNVHLDPDGVGTHVDFTTINTTISTRLAAERRCGLCAGPMGYWVAFLGTPRSAELLRFTDPPGHPACVTAALTLCPHIALARHRRARADRPSAGIMPPGAHGAKPAGWTVGITHGMPDLLTSDRPVFMSHGVADERCFIAVPLSPRFVFFGTRDETTFHRVMAHGIESIAISLNESLVTQADKYVYAAHDQYLPFVEDRLLARMP